MKKKDRKFPPGIYEIWERSSRMKGREWGIIGHIKADKIPGYPNFGKVFLAFRHIGSGLVYDATGNRSNI